MAAFKRLFWLIAAAIVPVQLWAITATDLGKSVKVSIPENWAARDPSGIHQLVLVCPENEANIFMFSQKIGNASLARCENAWVQNIRKKRTYKIVSRQSTKLAGINGKLVSFTASVRSEGSVTKLRYVQILAVKNKLLYVFQFVCKESDYKSCVPAFNGVISGLKWLK